MNGHLIIKGFFGYDLYNIWEGFPLNYFTVADARKAKLPKNTVQRQQLRNAMSGQLITLEMDKVNAAFNASMKRRR